MPARSRAGPTPERTFQCAKSAVYRPKPRQTPLPAETISANMPFSLKIRPLRALGLRRRHAASCRTVAARVPRKNPVIVPENYLGSAADAVLRSSQNEKFPFEPDFTGARSRQAIENTRKVTDAWPFSSLQTKPNRRETDPFKPRRTPIAGRNAVVGHVLDQTDPLWPIPGNPAPRRPVLVSW